MPVGYHGRASSIVASGAPVQPAERAAQARRPRRRRASARAATSTSSSSSASGSGPATRRARRSRSREAGDHVAGFCLLNDWSARDIQAWEYQPLGPFLGKSFATTISPWVVTPEALAPFRIAQAQRPAGDPRSARLSRRRARTSGTARSTSRSKCSILTEGLRTEGSCRRNGSRSATRGISTGRWRRWSRTTPAAAAISRPATCSAPARSRRRATTAWAACWS